MFCPVPPSVIAIFPFFAGPSPTHRGGITHEFAPDHCSLYFLCAAHLRFYIPFFGFIELMGLGTPWLIIQAKNLCTSKSPPSLTKRPAAYAASAKGVLAS